MGAISTPLIPDHFLAAAGQDGLLSCFYTLDVFTVVRFGGNPLAVFPQAEGLTSAQMQRIAQELNLSETVFVLPPRDPRHTCQVRIFTPKTELAFAGHPTVGTGFLLAVLSQEPLPGDRVTFILEEGVGPVPVTVFFQNGQPRTAQLSAAQLPELGPEPPDRDAIATVLNLDPSEIVYGEDFPQAWSCGLPYLFVPVCDRKALAKAQINRAAWELTLANHWAPQVYVFTRDTGEVGVDLRSRMFAPALGIVEDPATGSAATALGGYLTQRSPQTEGIQRWQVAQGIEMGRPSQLEIEVEQSENEITAVRVGGRSVLVSCSQMLI